MSNYWDTLEVLIPESESKEDDRITLPVPPDFPNIVLPNITIPDLPNVSESFRRNLEELARRTNAI